MGRARRDVRRAPGGRAVRHRAYRRADSISRSMACQAVQYEVTRYGLEQSIRARLASGDASPANVRRVGALWLALHALDNRAAERLLVNLRAEGVE